MLTEAKRKHMSTPRTPISATEWPGGRFIVFRSVVDFFTNIVPWLVGALAFVPLILVFILQIINVSSNAGSSAGLNIASAVLGIAGGIALIYVSICWVSATPLYGLARADGKTMSTKDMYKV